MGGTEKDRKNYLSTRGGSKCNKEANRDDECYERLPTNQPAGKFVLRKGKKYIIVHK